MYDERIAALKQDLAALIAAGWNDDDAKLLAARIRALAVVTARTIESVERDVFTSGRAA